MASRHAAYTFATSRLDSFRPAIETASASQSSTVARAMGARQRIATWALTPPPRTSSCTASGSSSTNDSRRDTQLGLRPNDRANASWLIPKPRCNARSSQPCSKALSPSPVRSDRDSSRASASPMSHTVARTTSR
jgi:hypothetical protein